jgi:hypothetical protein
MSHRSVTVATWRVLILDRDPAIPKWLLATVTLRADVRPPRSPRPLRRYPDFDDVARRVRDSVRHPVGKFVPEGLVT